MGNQNQGQAIGAIDTRAQFDGGYLYVKTDKTFYYKGDVVFGKIYIRVNRTMQANFLEIDVKAKEKASHWDEVEDANNNRYWVKVQYIEKYFEFK